MFCRTRCTFLALGIISGIALASSAQAQTETLTAIFTTPDGGVTTNFYSGDVLVNVTGVGQSYSTAFNDAFYVYRDQAGNPITPSNPYINPTNPLGLAFYQLAFSPNTLTARDTNEAAFLSVVGGLPAYKSSHDYTFILNTGLNVPGKLHFGVTDGQYSDNTGAFTIKVTATPEPGSIALLAGLGLSGGMLLRRRKRGTTTS